MELKLLLVLVVALVLAVGLAVLAWQLLRGDRRRTEARAAMLRQLALEPDQENVDEDTGDPETRWQDAIMPPPVFATVSRTPAPSRRWVAVVVATLFMALGAGTVYGLYGPVVAGVASLTSAAGETPAAPDQSARRTNAQPLELLSLSHRTDNGDFVVAGLIQNPSDGQPAPTVMAVVYVFDAKGDYFASGKAALEFGALAPGAESPFVVRLPKTAGVSRFRVGFRAVDGSVVAHVDRRGKPIEGTTAGAPSMSAGS